MRHIRLAIVVGVAAAVVAAAAGCGDDTSKTSVSPAASKVDCGGKKVLKASGSSAQKNAIEQFVYAYVRSCMGQTLDYNANGSGKGVADFVDGRTDLAGTDSPLDAKKNEPAMAQQRCGSPAWNLPAVFGPIAVSFNIKGVDSLNLDGPTAAKIFNGAITTWDDPAIKALNDNANLPSIPIHVVFRSDESGTTDNFQRYLDIASDGAWGKGVGKSFKGGLGEGVETNDGIAAALKRTNGSISYTEWSFAVGHELLFAKIVTSAGPDPVDITPDTVGKTIAGAKISGEGNDLVLDTSTFYVPTERDAYPIVLVTYEVVCSKYPDPATGKAVRAFMQATIGEGQVDLDQYGYMPLPASFKERLATAVNAIA